MAERSGGRRSSNCHPDLPSAHRRASTALAPALSSALAPTLSAETGIRAGLKSLLSDFADDFDELRQAVRPSKMHMEAPTGPDPNDPHHWTLPQLRAYLNSTGLGYPMGGRCFMEAINININIKAGASWRPLTLTLTLRQVLHGGH